MHLRGKKGDVWKPGEDGVGPFGCAEERDKDDITLMDTMIFQDFQSCEDRCSRLWGYVCVCVCAIYRVTHCTECVSAFELHSPAPPHDQLCGGV